MDSQICQHYKYGFCKYKNQCQKDHVKGQCEALSACEDINANDLQYKCSVNMAQSVPIHI